ncbi:hypothetical protein BUE93_21105 [Chromobacterium amazonense]|uniref:Antirestriction protein n=1 Tax=Chromobacterium amazonense TaxID=1382803 RepID=A0A2S9WYX5_9NEIS|nr:antirestriction protein [Chromobacterium amazonense]PRP68668.1 hypothetical protein BUE93_21105 [Chromobacterium amazonense]
MAFANCTTQVQKSVVPDAESIDFMPGIFGMKCLRVEMLVFSYMDKLSADYAGGRWVFCQLSNGGFFMYPQADQPMRIFVDGNHFEGSMSAEAAGIVACLFALCHFASECDLGGEHYHLLRDYALDHPEASGIFQAID